jgi:hypothetical protein
MSGTRDLCKERHGAIQTSLKPYFAGVANLFGKWANIWVGEKAWRVII